jgi:hypothetical protein
MLATVLRDAQRIADMPHNRLRHHHQITLARSHPNHEFLAYGGWSSQDRYSTLEYYSNTGMGATSSPS